MRSVPLVAALLCAAIAACSKPDESGKTAPSAPPPSPVAATARIERPPLPSREGASLVLGTVAGKKLAFVADEDSASVRVVDLGAGHEIAHLGLGGRPGQMLVTDGRLAVALRDDASVALLDAHPDGSLTVAKKTDTETEPVALALSPDDATLFVATGWSRSLEAFPIGEDGLLGERTLDVPLAREPRAVSVTSDGKRAFVAHAAASQLEVVDLATKAAASTDLGIRGTSPPPMKHMIREPFRRDVMIDALVPATDGDFIDDSLLALPARFARQGYALAHVSIATSKGPREMFVLPHTEVMTGDPMVVSSGYGGGGLEASGVDVPAERFTLSTLDPASGRRVLLSNAGDARDKTGCHLPRGAATDGAGNVYVACFGSDSLMAFALAEKTYDEPQEPDSNAKLVVDANGNMVAPPRVKKIPYLSMSLTGRIPVAAGPSGVAWDPDEKRLVAFSQIDGALSIVAGDKVEKKIDLQRPSGLGEQVARGRKIFYSGGDARVAKDGRACSSCHPEGRDDGLVWSTPDGPRQTIMLAGRENRPGPFGWLGKHATLQIHMQSTMKNLKGTGLEPPDRDALAAFVATLRGPSQKWRALSDEEARGRDVFQSSDAQCSSCHVESSGFTDHDVHDVKSATFADGARQFLVPSLANVGASAPYFHDGRYASLEDLIEKCDGTMGSTKQLAPEDKKALAAYLRTL